MTSGIAPRLSLVTLGVEDVERATAFYRALGWEPSGASVSGEVSFFALQGAILGLRGRDHLAADANVAADANLAAARPGSARPGSVACAINLESRAAVDAAFERAREAGAAIPKAPEATDWGGYSGYFADPDGHLWEVAHNPFWPIGDDGRPVLP